MIDHIFVKQASVKDEIISGLKQEQKQLPSKYFYDERGSRLFERITGLKEYYLSRAEKSILVNHTGGITEFIGQDAMLIEPGSGSSKKTRLLLDALPSLAAYIPVDISEEYLQKVAAQLKKDYPALVIKPVCADYTTSFELPDIEESYHKQVVFFPGSTIGNFKPQRARIFLQSIAGMIADEGGMLIGIDLKKDRKILEAAYNDSEGVTAEFNKNILVRLNRELNADFDVDSFSHYAFYNEEEGCIEMHLVSEGEQQVQVAGEFFRFEKGETIHTENSYKYSTDDFKKLVADWFSVEKVWMDDSRLFSLQYLAKK